MKFTPMGEVFVLLDKIEAKVAEFTSRMKQIASKDPTLAEVDRALHDRLEKDFRKLEPRLRQVTGVHGTLDAALEFLRLAPRRTANTRFKMTFLERIEAYHAESGRSHRVGVEEHLQFTSGQKDAPSVLQIIDVKSTQPHDELGGEADARSAYLAAVIRTWRARHKIEEHS